MEQKTVRVFPVEGHPRAVWLWWDREINSDDVPLAFQALTAAMDKADRPIHVLVDLRSNPAMPLSITLQETLGGPWKHDRMGLWLVIGTNWRAKILANTFNKVNPRANIHWFETEEEALIYLTEIEEAASGNETIA